MTFGHVWIGYNYTNYNVIVNDYKISQVYQKQRARVRCRNFLKVMRCRMRGATGGQGSSLERAALLFARARLAPPHEYGLSVHCDMVYNNVSLIPNGTPRQPTPAFQTDDIIALILCPSGCCSPLTNEPPRTERVFCTSSCSSMAER